MSGPDNQHFRVGYVDAKGKTKTITVSEPVSVTLFTSLVEASDCLCAVVVDLRSGEIVSVFVNKLALPEGMNDNAEDQS